MRPRYGNADIERASGCIVHRMQGMTGRGATRIAGNAEAVVVAAGALKLRDALTARGLHPAEPMAGDWTANSGYRIGLKLAEDKEMTAVYAANDQMAMGVIAAAACPRT